MNGLQSFKIPACILSVLIAVALGVMMWRGHQEELATEAELERMNDEAQVYLDEIEELQDELAALQESVVEESTDSRAMIGFCISDVDDVEFISEMAEEYDFTPVVLLDCNDDIEDIESYIDATAESDWEYMLTGTPFSSDTNENALLTIDYLKESGLSDCGVFLLRSDDNSSSNRLMLEEDGFEGYTLYAETPVDGVAEETGMLYFSYSYVRSYSSTLDTQIEYLSESGSAMIVVFDMGSVNDGSMTEDEVRSGLDSIYSRVESAGLVVSSVSEVADGILEAAQEEAERQAENEEYEAQLQARIEELRELVSEVYAQ